MPAGDPTVHHEESDVDVRGVLAFAAALVVFSIVVTGIVWGFYRYFEAREARQPQPSYPLAAQQADRVPPEPRLQTNPREDLRQLREQEDLVLTTYGWVDENAGVVRIPIDVAMKLTVERGLPARRQDRPRP